jgi:ATP:ADP antiporter, AAA family
MVLQIYLLLLSYYPIRLVRETLILVEGSPEVRSYATGAIAVTLIFVIPLYKLLFDYLKNGGRKSAVITWVGGFLRLQHPGVRLPGRWACRSPYPSTSGSASST